MIINRIGRIFCSVTLIAFTGQCPASNICHPYHTGADKYPDMLGYAADIDDIDRSVFVVILLI